MATRYNYGVSNLRQQNLFEDYPSMNIMDDQQFMPQFDVDEAPQPDYMQPTGSFNRSRFGQNLPLPMAPPPRVGQPATQEDAYSTQSILDAINKVYTPETADRDRFRNLLDNAPQRQDPSLMRRFAAAGVGLGNRSRGIPGGLGEMEKVLQAPYLRDLTEWKEKVSPFSQAAQQENTANVNERNLASSVVTNSANMARVQAQERAAAEKNRIAEVRAKAYAWKQMHPDWDWDTTGPTYVLKGPNGEIKNTGIKTGEMGEEDLQILKNKGAVAAARERGANATENAGVRGTQLLQDKNNNQYSYNPDTNQITPLGGAPPTPTGPLNRVGTPSQSRGTGGGTGADGTPTNTLEFNRQKQLRLENTFLQDPVGKQFVKKGNNNLYEMTPRPVLGEHHGLGSLWGGGNVTSQEEVDAWDDLREYIDPTYKRPAPVAPREQGGRGGGAGPVSGANQPPPQTNARPGIGPRTTPSKAPLPPPGSITDQIQGGSRGPKLNEILFPKSNAGTPLGIAGQMSKPAFENVEEKQQAIDQLQQAGAPVTEENINLVLSGQPPVTPPNPNSVRVRNIQTGEMGWVSGERAQAAIASGKFEKVR